MVPEEIVAFQAESLLLPVDLLLVLPGAPVHGLVQVHHVLDFDFGRHVILADLLQINALGFFA